MSKTNSRPQSNPSIPPMIGFLTGFLLIPTLWNAGVRNLWIYLLSPIAFMFLAVGLIKIGNRMSRHLSISFQFSKFIVVGLMSTSIDFGVLNTLSILSGVKAGLAVGAINIPGFSVAVFNAYLWHKMWVFGKRGEEHIMSDFPKFLLITGIGVLINSAILTLVTTHISPPLSISESLWLNLAKGFATVFSLIWNFIGYKFVVFGENNISAILENKKQSWLLSKER